MLTAPTVNTLAIPMKIVTVVKMKMTIKVNTRTTNEQTISHRSNRYISCLLVPIHFH